MDQLHHFTSRSSFSSPSSMIDHVSGYEVRSRLSAERSDLSNESSACAGDDSTPSEGEAPLERDYFDGVLKYINQMLMDEDLETRPCMLQDSLALQAAEKSFYDALTKASCDCNFSDKSPNSVAGQVESRSHFGLDFLADHQNYQSGLEGSSANHSSSVDDGRIVNPMNGFAVLGPPSVTKSHFTFLSSQDQTNVTPLIENNYSCLNCGINTPEQAFLAACDRERNMLGKRYSYHEDGDAVEGRASKQLAGSVAELERTEVYDKALLCSANNPGFYSDPPRCHIDHSLEQKLRFKPVNVASNESKRGRPRAGEKQVSSGKAVDLRSLLLQCAQAAANYASRTASELLRSIRLHSSAYGDATERMAHYFANSLEARLAGTGTELYTAFSRRRMSAADMLKAYQVYVTACPFKKMSNIFANKSIGKLTRQATAIHIIDFGILYGFQWPCFIQGISLRPSGPPKLRITGIDFPQPGFRPAERVEETGRRLANYCKRFNVPFEYNAIAKRWDSIHVEELKIDRDETLIVNCLYRLKNTPDETVLENSPRDAVLNLIKEINPDFFVHGVINGTYNSSFFVTRFKEALFHFSSLFDMYDATVPREDQERLLYEKEIFGRDIMNIVACEGTERVERPESYKQWQLRNQRAGLRQIALNQDVIKEVRTKVRLRYHKDFLVDEDSNWMLQGWKGRVLYALSCWTPVD